MAITIAPCLDAQQLAAFKALENQRVLSATVAFLNELGALRFWPVR
jgi:hypothetical protein